MWFSTKRSVYSDMPSFLSQSAICSIVTANGPPWPDGAFRPSHYKVYTDTSGIARPPMRAFFVVLTQFLGALSESLVKSISIKSGS
jgi:hypothetical protein